MRADVIVNQLILHWTRGNCEENQRTFHWGRPASTAAQTGTCGQVNRTATHKKAFPLKQQRFQIKEQYNWQTGEHHMFMSSRDSCFIHVKHVSTEQSAGKPPLLTNHKRKLWAASLTWWAPREGCLVLRSRTWLSCEGSREVRLEEEEEKGGEQVRKSSEEQTEERTKGSDSLFTCFLMLLVTSSQCCNETHEGPMQT